MYIHHCCNPPTLFLSFTEVILILNGLTPPSQSVNHFSKTVKNYTLS